MRNVVSWKPLVLGASFLLYGAGTAFATETDHLYPTPSTGFMSVQQDGRQINCHIVDKSGPIVGANVVVKGTTIGNISDMDGRDRKSTRLNSSHPLSSRMPSSA